MPDVIAVMADMSMVAGGGAGGAVGAGVSSSPQATMMTLNAKRHAKNKDIFQFSSLRGKVKIATS
jgi:hypothetical protein